MFTLRNALPEDIPALHTIRVAVNENKLSDPSRIRAEDYREFLLEKGKGWVAEIQGQVAGFAIVDLKGCNVWALFIDPAHEGKGLGRALHAQMLHWYFEQTSQPLWLSTAPGTRAERFYRLAGWNDTGPYGSGEIRFEMKTDDWQSQFRHTKK